MKSDRWPRGCSDPRGHAARFPCSAQAGRCRGRRGERVEKGWIAGARPPRAPQRGGAGGSQTRHPKRLVRRTPRAQLAPCPPEPRTHRPSGGRIPVSPQCPGLGPARPAGGRLLHAAASSARPAPAPPAHFPQEMINSRPRRVPMATGSDPGGGGAARARSCTHSHTHTRDRPLRQTLPLGLPKPPAPPPHMPVHTCVLIRAHTQRPTCSHMHGTHIYLHTCSREST